MSFVWIGMELSKLIIIAIVFGDLNNIIGISVPKIVFIVSGKNKAEYWDVVYLIYHYELLE